jgi:hypothetical protein
MRLQSIGDRISNQRWNFSVQGEFSPTLVAGVGYVGTHGVHIHQIVKPNAAAPNGASRPPACPYLAGDRNQYTRFGDMSYNGLQSRVRERIGGSLIGASYRFEVHQHRQRQR